MIEALQHFHLSDAADVAIVATGLYATLCWLRRSQAALVAVGFALLGALYLGARFFGLGLTEWALNGFFAALALVLVVVFQDELRQALEELAVDHDAMYGHCHTDGQLHASQPPPIRLRLARRSSLRIYLR